VPPPLYAGRALVLRDARMGTHLWFVLTDPDPDRNSMVLVMLVTVKPHTDRTLHLDVGDIRSCATSRPWTSARRSTFPP
jgi:hypothetical protein